MRLLLCIRVMRTKLGSDILLKQKTRCILHHAVCSNAARQDAHRFEKRCHVLLGHMTETYQRNACGDLCVHYISSDSGTSCPDTASPCARQRFTSASCASDVSWRVSETTRPYVPPRVGSTTRV